MADFDEEGAAARLNYQHSSAGATPLMAAAGKGRIHEVLLMGSSCYMPPGRIVRSLLSSSCWCTCCG